MFSRFKDVWVLPLAIGCWLSLEAADRTESQAAPCACIACSCSAEGDCRAGNPQCIARHAQPSNTPSDSGYYVGGGAPFHGQPRFSDEGTWGWDYSGRFLDRRIWLNWWHGERAQGGAGQYKTDGPRLLH
jgi:hypothetical protein